MAKLPSIPVLTSLEGLPLYETKALGIGRPVSCETTVPVTGW
jgi:hypothetical protein